MTIKKYKITWSPQAYSDLQKIHFYLKYYLKEPNISNNLIKELLSSISSLSYFPEKFTKIQYSYKKTKNIRRMLINNYVVLYEVNTNTRSSFYFTYFS